MGSQALTEAQLQLLAQMQAREVDRKQIVLATGLSEYRVKKITERKEGAESGLTLSQQNRYDTLLSQARQAAYAVGVRHSMKMEEMVEDAYGALNSAVNSFDVHPELATKTAWEILKNAGAPVHSEREITTGATANTQVNFYASPKGVEAVETVVSAITEMRGEMAVPLPPIGASSPHLRTSEADVLPISPSVVSAEPSPPEAGSPSDTE